RSFSSGARQAPSPQPMSSTDRIGRSSQYSAVATASATLRASRRAPPMPPPRYQRSKYSRSYCFSTLRIRASNAAIVEVHRARDAGGTRLLAGLAASDGLLQRLAIGIRGSTLDADAQAKTVESRDL